MKLINADAFDALLVDAQRRAKNNFQYGFLSSVRENLAMMPEAEAYTEARERIENMEKIIEDQQERIDIMAADVPVHCKDCMYNIWNGSNESPSFWTPCEEIKPEDHWFCWCGTPKPPKEGASNG